MTLRIGFSGDVSFTGVFAAPAPPADRFDPEVAAFLRGCDHAVLNVEGPLTERPGRAGIGTTLASPPAVAAEGMAFLGSRVWNLANNHVLDSGAAGLADTLSAARAAGARPLGAGLNPADAAAPLVVEKDGVRVGLLCVCEEAGSSTGDGGAGVMTDADPARVRAALAELRRGCDHVVLSYHGGEEYTFVPMPRRRRRLLGLLAQGADVVVAHHAHTVQGWERVGRGLIFYGLGNFVFDIPIHRRRPGTDQGVLLRLSFDRGGVAWDACFTRMDRAAGRVAAAPPIPSFAQVDGRGLRAAWCRDAHRVVTLPRTSAAPAEPAASAGSTAFPAPDAAPAAPRARRLLRIPGLRAAWAVARSRNYRPVVLAALEHRVRMILGAAAPDSPRGATESTSER